MKVSSQWLLEVGTGGETFNKKLERAENVMILWGKVCSNKSKVMEEKGESW